MVAMFPSLSNDFTNWDDDIYVTNNPDIGEFSSRQWTEPVGGNYHPLTMISLTIDYKIGGGEAVTFHINSFLLHLINVVLVFWFVWLISNGSAFTAFIVALLFGIHPMHVESVAWVSARKDLLYSSFFLGGLIAYRHFLDDGKLRTFGIVIALFILSLLSKPAAIVFPFAVVALHYFSGKSPQRADVIRLLPLIIVAIAWALLTVDSQTDAGSVDKAGFDPLRQFTIAGYTTAFYLFKFFLPIEQSAYFPMPDGNESLSGIYYLGLLVTIGLIVAAIFFRKKMKELSFGIAFFLINLALVSQIFPFGHALVAERYTYLPYIGLAFPIAVFARQKWTSIKPGPAKQGIQAAGIAVATALIYLSIVRCQVWENSETLWTDVIEGNDGVALAFGKRGEHFAVNKEEDKAIADYSNALKLDAEYPEVWHNLGEIWMERGMKGKALEHFDKALEFKPQYAAAWNNRGNVFFRDQRWESAIEEYTKAIEADNEYVKAYINRGNARLRLGKLDEAMVDLNRAIEIAPNYAEAWFVRAFIFRDKGDQVSYRNDLMKSSQLGYPVPENLLR